MTLGINYIGVWREVIDDDEVQNGIIPHPEVWVTRAFC